MAMLRNFSITTEFQVSKKGGHYTAYSPPTWGNYAEMPSYRNRPGPGPAAHPQLIEKQMKIPATPGRMADSLERDGLIEGVWV
jgi:hypothetical protein